MLASFLKDSHDRNKENVDMAFKHRYLLEAYMDIKTDMIMAVLKDIYRRQGWEWTFDQFEEVNRGLKENRSAGWKNV